MKEEKQSEERRTPSQDIEQVRELLVKQAVILAKWNETKKSSLQIPIERIAANTDSITKILTVLLKCSTQEAQGLLQTHEESEFSTAVFEPNGSGGFDVSFIPNEK